jgi:hypothetical protein
MSLSAFPRFAIVALLSLCACGASIAATPDSTARPGYEPIALFQAIERGDVSATVHVRDATQLNIAIENHTDRPLAIEMPDVFAAVPVHAQFQPGGLQQFNQNNGAQNQAVGAPGGPFNQGNQGNQGNNGFNRGFFNVPPGKIVKAKQPCICLEHGKADPSPQLDYEIRPLESVIDDPQVAELTKRLVQGTDRRLVQLAIWHRANGIAWEELAALEIDRLGRPDTRQYSKRELSAARELLERVAELGQDSAGDASPGEVSAR